MSPLKKTAAKRRRATLETPLRQLYEPTGAARAES